MFFKIPICWTYTPNCSNPAFKFPLFIFLVAGTKVKKVSEIVTSGSFLLEGLITLLLKNFLNKMSPVNVASLSIMPLSFYYIILRVF